MCSVQFPSTFSPGSREKGFFAPRLINATADVLFNMIISDAEGKVVCETYGQQKGWDGTHHGEPCPTGNYHYRATILEMDKDPSQQFQANGYVKLLR